MNDPGELRAALDEFLDDTSRVRFVHCPHGCLIAVCGVGCEHGHAVGGQEGDDLEASGKLVTIASRLSIYFDALVNAGFDTWAALHLVGQMQALLTVSAFGPE